MFFFSGWVNSWLVICCRIRCWSLCGIFVVSGNRCLVMLRSRCWWFSIVLFFLFVVFLVGCVSSCCSFLW